MNPYTPKPADLRTLATMLGLPLRYTARAARVLELWEPSPQANPPTIVSPKQVYSRLRHLGRAKKEHLVGLYLDAQNRLVGQETISIGSLNITRTNPREIFYPAITNLSLGFILAHNHPSGSLDPSDKDIAFTRAIHRASETLGIQLFDHVIISNQGYTSLRKRGNWSPLWHGNC